MLPNAALKAMGKDKVSAIMYGLVRLHRVFFYEAEGTLYLRDPMKNPMAAMNNMAVARN